MQEVIRFVRDFIRAEYEARIAQHTERDRAVLRKCHRCPKPPRELLR